MPFSVMIAADQQNLIQSVCSILRLLSLSCAITLTTNAAEKVGEYLREQEPNLLILGFSKSSARSVIHEARERRPGMRVLWIGETDEQLPEADASMPQPLTALRLIDTVMKMLK